MLSGGKNFLVISGLGIILSFMLGSCANTRQFTYMQGTFDTAKLSVVLNKEPVVGKGDILSIVVYSDNAGASAFYNLGGGSGVATAPSSSGAAAPTASAAVG